MAIRQFRRLFSCIFQGFSRDFRFAFARLPGQTHTTHLMVTRVCAQRRKEPAMMYDVTRAMSANGRTTTTADSRPRLGPVGPRKARPPRAPASSRGREPAVAHFRKFPKTSDFGQKSRHFVVPLGIQCPDERW